MQCSNPEPVRFGLYVDGSAISGSGLRSSSGAGEPMRPFSLQGVTGPLTGGEHVLQIMFDCLGGDLQIGASFPDGAITAVLLGS
jgi:hypothetical protein